jgi:excisionase family DNA binding protein
METITAGSDPLMLLTREEVARILRCSPMTVTRLVTAGRLKTRRITPAGKKLVFKREDVATYINSL